MIIITSAELAVYLRMSTIDMVAADQIVDITNGLVEEVTGPLLEIPARVSAGALAIAARAYLNPQGYTSQTVGQVTWRADVDRSGVYMTAAERHELLAALPDPNLDAPAWAGSMPYLR